MEHPSKMDGHHIRRWDDTIIMNGFKLGPTDTVIQLTPTDFYDGRSVDPQTHIPISELSDEFLEWFFN